MISSLLINFLFWVVDTLVMLADIIAIIFRGVRYD